MKKQIALLITGIILAGSVMGQSGNLVPDSTKITKDTLTCHSVVYLKDHKTLAVDSGYIVRELAPLVFVTPGSTNKVRTDQTGILATRYFVMPGRKELEAEDIVFLKIKPENNGNKKQKP